MVESKDKVFSILSYIFILIGVIWYLVDKSIKTDFNTFHFKQALNMFIVFFVIGFIIGFVATFVPFLGLISLALWVVQIVFLVLQIIAIVKEEKKEVPVIGAFAEKYLTF